jgi:hypothetical protein
VCSEAATPSGVVLARFPSGRRVHSDDAAALGARALGARAYTIGSHHFFGSGQYSPSTVGGQKLLAHELTHGASERMGLRGVTFA